MVDPKTHAETVNMLYKLVLENGRLRAEWAAITVMIDKQANDENLWQTGPEVGIETAFLQQALRELHALIEGLPVHD